MLPALWVAKTGLSAQDTNLTTISNNLANVSTTGFKRDRAEFQDLLYQIKKQPGAQSTQDRDYEIGNWYVSTHPASVFVGQLKAALLAPGKRHTLNNANYAVHYLDRPSEKRAIESADELLTLLQGTFGIRLPAHPQLREIVAGLIMANSKEG